jgi:hypothetical protein
MASSRLPTLLHLVVSCALGACAHSDPREFALRSPVSRDPDLDPVHLRCPKLDEGAASRPCAPEPYESSFAWDAADNSIFRPVSKFFEVDEYGESENVNALDEVPDSSWFTNRIGARSMSPEEVASGYCSEGPQLVSDPPDGAWLIDRGKDNGANPGFRVKVNETNYMLKTDDKQAERATAATVIASRFYYAAGYWAPCDSIVYFGRRALRLQPGLKVKANTGPTRPFDAKRLEEILAAASRRGERYRSAASRWLPGIALGPFTYEGTRADDPSDVVAHENRRDLRGARLLAAWLNHFDSREQNTMSTWMPVQPERHDSPGHVRHWQIDLGDCFGSEWTVLGMSKRLGHSYMLDVGYMAEDFATLGIVERPWDRARRTPGAENFGFFSARDFDPELWRGEYPNPAFGRMTERDAAWAARIIARFEAAHIRAAVSAGDLTRPAHSDFLFQVLLERQRILLRRYLSRLSPITDVRVDGRRLCALDLGRRSGVFSSASFEYRASIAYVGRSSTTASVSSRPNGEVCLELPSARIDPALSDDAPERYLVIDITNGVAPGRLRVHLYDFGARRGLRLVAIERPSS